MSVFTFCVERPLQIEHALHLLEEALERAPGKGIPVYQQSFGRYHPLKRFIAVDAELKPVPHHTDENQAMQKKWK